MLSQKAAYDFHWLFSILILSFFKSWTIFLVKFELIICRGDYAIQIGRNLIHGSDGTDSAKAEISLWFKEEEIAEYDSALEKWIYE